MNEPQVYLFILLKGTVSREVWGLQVPVAVTIQQVALVEAARILGTTLPHTGKLIKASHTYQCLTGHEGSLILDAIAMS